MNTRAAIGLWILISVAVADAATGAEKLSVPALGGRLAARPAGAEAESLAGDVRHWFGKGQNGRNNVITGANPRVEGLDTAWAIEAPDAKTAAVVTSDGKTIPLSHIDGTPMFAATLTLPAGSAFRFTYVTDGNKEGRKGQVEVYTDGPNSRKCPVCPEAS